MYQTCENKELEVNMSSIEAPVAQAQPHFEGKASSFFAVVTTRVCVAYRRLP